MKAGKITKEQIMAAIQKAIDRGADNPTDPYYANGIHDIRSSRTHPKAKEARDLTDFVGCDWDFDGWASALRTVRAYGELGGVDFK